VNLRVLRGFAMHGVETTAHWLETGAPDPGPATSAASRAASSPTEPTWWGRRSSPCVS